MKSLSDKTQNIAASLTVAIDTMAKQMIADGKDVVSLGAGGNEALDKDNMLQYLSPADLKKFGLIPEIVGRLPIITHLNPLDKDALKRILTEPKNALVKQFQKLFAMDHIKLVIKDTIFVR